MNSLEKAQTIHFVGIGGIGISAIAHMKLMEGKKISGSDRDASRVTEELQKAGATIYIGQKSEHIPQGCDLVVYTNAVGEDNPEIIEAKKREIAMLSYPQTLDIVSKEKFTIAISGTHGKTTTTAMVAKVLIDAGLDPTVIVGSLMKFPDGRESNFVAGKSQYLVVEADEYKKSFHNLHPTILVINNIDEDHLDFYKDLADIQNAFSDLVCTLPKEGFLVCNPADPHVAPVLQSASCPILDYNSAVLSIKLKIPGKHNLQNAKAALVVAGALGVPVSKAEQSLEEFEGVWRRFEYKGITKEGAIVYDDYAHNPQKVEALVEAAREQFPGKKITVVFQPHLFSRTKSLFNGFVESLSHADQILLAPIFPAREALDPSISSEMLGEALKAKGRNAQAFNDLESIVSHLRAHPLDSQCVLFTVGAGEAYKVGEALVHSSQ